MISKLRSTVEGAHVRDFRNMVRTRRSSSTVRSPHFQPSDTIVRKLPGPLGLLGELYRIPVSMVTVTSAPVRLWPRT